MLLVILLKVLRLWCESRLGYMKVINNSILLLLFD